ncbi:MAG: response regulator [Candidatus Margulisbacteria bacterium]|nr:response regulator [Candidatus Margulisiibacteriota bacterium]
MPKILVVDDNADMIELMKTRFEMKGFDTRIATDGEEAWKIIKESSPDVVLADHNLPGISGSQLCEKIKNDPKLKNIVVILASASVADEIGSISRRVSADDYIAKGVDNFDSLFTKVTNLLKQKGKMPS